MPGPVASVALAALLAGGAHADVYMHNPRGSNDRNCERNVNRNNGNRMFDSQNNAKGGYACPRAVGDNTVQAENGQADFGDITQQMKMYYFEGSVLPIEWTNQHGCGDNSKTNCEIVMQYMCEDTADPQVDGFWPYTETKNAADNAGAQAFRSGDDIAAPRDGIPRDADDSATDTIADTEDAAIPDTEEDQRMGMHESFDTYQLCQRTERNKGLYTADQRMRRNDARGTRQNPNGDRRGLECPEERDYYPYWRPSPWVDVAIMTNDGGDAPCNVPETCETNRCEYYLANSFNKRTSNAFGDSAKGFCDVAKGGDVADKIDSAAWAGNEWHNNRAACEADGFEWFEIALDDVLTGMEYPICQKTEFSRVNQLGNSGGVTTDGSYSYESNPQGLNANRFLWTIPTIPEADASVAGTYFDGHNGNGIADAYESCTVRIRYNITTSDFPAWPPQALDATSPWKYAMVTAANNSDANADNAANTPVLQDPYVYVGVGDTAALDDKFVSLALNTNQYARTFQDRSYSFKIKARPTAEVAADLDADTPKVLAMAADAKVYNLNVRGKRGNVVQTFPAVEYDFVPNQLAMEAADYVHFQWTGSDYNPRRGCNDAEGGPPDPNDFRTAANGKSNSRADRSNIVLLNSMAENVPMDLLGDPDATGDDAAVYAAAYAAAMAAATASSPCQGSADGEEACYEQLMRLTYLNQQQDGGALALRRGDACLTEAEIDAIGNKNQRENHPLNCAKLNAKPYPYFDGGVMQAATAGSFTFFSSRNNNFSNRDQTGIVCVRGTDDDGNQHTCTPDNNGVLQDKNTMLSTSAQRIAGGTLDASRCNDQASSGSAANAAGATSCIGQANDNDVLTGATTAREQKDNDAIGDGNKDACDKIFWFYNNLSDTEQALVLGLSLMAAGIVLVFSGNWAYNVFFRKPKTQFDGAAGAGWKGGAMTETELVGGLTQVPVSKANPAAV